MDMRQTLGMLLLALVLPVAGCGDDEPDPESGSASTPVLVAATSGGGDVATEATALDDDAAVTAYVGQFSDSFANEVSRAADELDVPTGSTLVAAVVSIGCDVPPGADVKRVSGGITIAPHAVASPLQECFAPVTTVALAAVPDPG
jgi:hypothetical protein